MEQGLRLFALYLMPLVRSSAVLLNRSLLNVPFVARIPIVFVFEFRAAGFMAGSIPIKGVLGYFS